MFPTDHDYIELLVNVKSESDSNMSELEEEPELVPEAMPEIQIKEEVITEEIESNIIGTVEELCFTIYIQLFEKHQYIYQIALLSRRFSCYISSIT